MKEKSSKEKDFSYSPPLLLRSFPVNFCKDCSAVLWQAHQLWLDQSDETYWLPLSNFHWKGGKKDCSHELKLERNHHKLAIRERKMQ